jgi:hypothetical protein
MRGPQVIFAVSTSLLPSVVPRKNYICCGYILSFLHVTDTAIHGSKLTVGMGKQKEGSSVRTVQRRYDPHSEAQFEDPARSENSYMLAAVLNHRFCCPSSFQQVVGGPFCKVSPGSRAHIGTCKAIL